MIITEFDSPLTAEEARGISLANKDDSTDRFRFRDLMFQVRYAASFGETRYQSLPMNRDLNPTEHVCNAFRSMGYKVTMKRAYKWDEAAKNWSDKPMVDNNGREQFFVEITWG